MLRMTVLASGSKGNSTVISTGSTSVLVDAGLSCRETLKRMAEAGEDPARLSGIVISHEHQDHVSGLAVLARKLGVPVYMTCPTHAAWKRWARKVQFAESPERAHIERLECFNAGESFSIGDLDVTSFTISHDAADPVGFVFKADGIRVALVTDLGYMTTNVKHHLRRCDGLMIESNHDLEMLRTGPYPWSVKQRVMSRVGHLSNTALAEFFETDYDGEAQFVILAHLSENNNHPELARGCAEQALERQRSLLHAHRLLLAQQERPLAPVTL